MRRLAAISLLSLAGPLAAAEELRWRCALTPDLVQLRCTFDAADSEARGQTETLAEVVEVSDRAREAPTAVVHGTRFPLDPSRTWFVDLWSPPTDPAFVELLARATICYRTPRCRVQVDLQAIRR